MCAVVGVYRRPESLLGSVSQYALSMLDNQSNRGGDGWGFAGFEGPDKPFRIRVSKQSVKNMSRGTAAWLSKNFGNSSTIIGHVRYATSGSVTRKNNHPVTNDPEGKLPPYERIALAFNGNIANAPELRTELARKGIVFETPTDTEVLLRLIEFLRKQQIANGQTDPDYEQIFREVDKNIDGACSMVLTDGLGNMLGYRNSLGIRPLWIAETKNGLVQIGSESSAFEGLKGTPKELPPGEILYCNRKARTVETKFVGRPDPHSTGQECTRPVKLCAFEALYFQNAASEIFGRSNDETRYQIGLQTAEIVAPQIAGISAKERDDILVVPVPNTGIPYARGLFHGLLDRGLVSSKAYTQAIIRHGHKRAFQSRTKDRLAEIERKYSVLPGSVKGKKVFVCDDTLVRGDASEVLTRKLYEAGAAEVHWVIGSPPILGSDYYGINLPSLEELAFWKVWQKSSAEERSHLYASNGGNAPLKANLKLLGEKVADLIMPAKARGTNFKVTVTYLPRKKLEAVLPGGADRYNLAYFTGHYPTSKGQQLFDANLDKLVAA